MYPLEAACVAAPILKLWGVMRADDWLETDFALDKVDETPQVGQVGHFVWKRKGLGGKPARGYSGSGGQGTGGRRGTVG